MPLFTVTMKAGRAAEEKNAISRAIHEASVNAGYPADDMFQRFLCLTFVSLYISANKKHHVTTAIIHYKNWILYYIFSNVYCGCGSMASCLSMQ